MLNPWTIYEGSDPAATRALFAELESRGLMGTFAVNLFRAQKSSARAKVYRGGVRGQGSYRAMAYDRKSWAIDNLTSILEKHAEVLGVCWGWRLDPNVQFDGRASYVLYINLPVTGEPQVSFHSPDRGKGPDYLGDWDGTHSSVSRILKFCERVLESSPGLAAQQRELYAAP